MNQVSRYHPLLVALHWLLAILIIFMLIVGFFVLTAMPNSDPQKIGVLMLHMSVGMLILALMAVRFAVRIWTVRPAAAMTGYPSLDRLAPITHYGFYALVLLMVATGFATALLAGLNQIVFQGTGDALPLSFAVYPSFVAHSFVAALLVGFITLHGLAALYHQLVRKDGLIHRMSFGRRVSDQAAPAKRSESSITRSLAR
jgi:cytochrome b561